MEQINIDKEDMSLEIYGERYCKLKSIQKHIIDKIYSNKLQEVNNGNN